MTDFNINVTTDKPPVETLLEPGRVVANEFRPTSFKRHIAWSILPMALWYLAANGLAYYFTNRQNWIDIRQEALVIYALATLYVVPWFLTIITGFMSWGYALRAYGPRRGTTRAFGIFVFQWLSVWAMTQASIHGHYVYFYSVQVYS